MMWLLWVSALVAVIASAFVQQAFEAHRGYVDAVEGASRLGWAVLISAVAVLLADLAVMIVYVIRRGKPDSPRGKAVTEHRPLSGISLRTPPLMGRSTRQTIRSKSAFVTMESLVDGTATFPERMMVVGIVLLCVSFVFIFVGVGLLLMRRLLIFVLFPVIPGLWLYGMLRDVRQDFQAARRRVAARSHAERAPAGSREE
jgi:hypothetical protein